MNYVFFIMIAISGKQDDEHLQALLMYILKIGSSIKLISIVAWLMLATGTKCRSTEIFGGSVS